jgi:peroxiredoxin
MARLSNAQMTAAAALRYKWRIGEHSMEKGDKAPDFSLPDQNGKLVSLQQLSGKTVVLFFFPKADTPG